MRGSRARRSTSSASTCTTSPGSCATSGHRSRAAGGDEPVVRAFGGATLAASAAAPEGLRVHRGSWPAQRVMVVHRRPSGAAFRAFTDSAQHRPWLQLRRAGATSRQVLLEGLGG